MKTAVMTDTNSGISKQEADSLGIFLLPMPVIIDEEMNSEIKFSRAFRRVEVDQAFRDKRFRLECRHLVKSRAPELVKLMQEVLVKSPLPAVAVIAVIIIIISQRFRFLVKLFRNLNSPLGKVVSSPPIPGHRVKIPIAGVSGRIVCKRETATARIIRPDIVADNGN